MKAATLRWIHQPETEDTHATLLGYAGTQNVAQIVDETPNPTTIIVTVGKQTATVVTNSILRTQEIAQAIYDIMTEPRLGQARPSRKRTHTHELSPVQRHHSRKVVSTTASTMPPHRHP